MGVEELACFYDATAWFDVEPGCDKSDVCEIEDLCAMWEGECPQFRCWSEEVYEAFSVARTDF